MALPLKSYIDGWAKRTHDQARFLVKHRATILAVTAIVAPGQLVAITAGIEGAIALDAVVEQLLAAYDPIARVGD